SASSFLVGVKRMLRHLITKIILAMTLVASAPIAWAEDFPARPVKIFVQTAAGSSLDVMARLIAEPLSQIWGQQAIIVNQAGARGGLQHLTVEWFRNRSGANLNMIHYPGAAQASNDVIAGRVPMMMQTIAPVAGIVAAGEVKLLAITSTARLPNYPDTPTVAETIPGFTSSGWSILVAPKGTPPDVVQKINNDLRAVLARPELIKKIEELGNYTRPMNPRELSDFVRE